jgi:hypothetical protein
VFISFTKSLIKKGDLFTTECGKAERCTFRKWDVGVYTESSSLRIVTGGGYL